MVVFLAVDDVAVMATVKAKLVLLKLDSVFFDIPPPLLLNGELELKWFLPEMRLVASRFLRLRV